MLTDANAYSGIAVTDMAAARTFYTDTLGLRTSEEYGLLWLHHPGGQRHPRLRAGHCRRGQLHRLELRGR
jgi:catechol 2,3-dioxygenase-like lactoylglutathione lyase family enzyme